MKKEKENEKKTTNPKKANWARKRKEASVYENRSDTAIPSTQARARAHTHTHAHTHAHAHIYIQGDVPKMLYFYARYHPRCYPAKFICSRRGASSERKRDRTLFKIGPSESGVSQKVRGKIVVSEAKRALSLLSFQSAGKVKEGGGKTGRR
jgi:hypothetical protein